ncbi:LacI family DNA-binding transcriptional regulator [Propionibacterium freudenreichii]|uniref:LacI family DNA-binding transcriptional regulator n=1 Tax=Propionibacterium freudenreichii TaxID=1744 RepID=UPI00054276B5|nr:LacI family DNA-binding transcriptional regulator [Propionibacterium freudenreichii]AJQ89968.1 Transcriptional repressor RbsR [Propionibacterium freudenreichii subsp. freudenreichii]MCT2980004.1 LacI family transcriptional regulator [Propionibacterium freudenreichii]MDK9342116.1 LacI family DNA-binding transcriptional regulator [Propionibacterium freudenreichii]CEG91100.1 LacI family transcriptional regulator [Propionibacterium freudenreichii]
MTHTAGPGPENPSVTIRQVAARAGVSKSSVSRFLQGGTYLSDAAREAIQAAVDELGYRPNAMARSLTERRTHAIGAMVNDLRQPWFGDFLGGLGAALHHHGYYMVVGDTRVDRHMDERLIHTFLESQVDGIVLAGTMPVTHALSEAIELMPTVIAGSRDFDDSPVDVTTGDDAAAAALVMHHLFDLGHRRIAHLAGPDARSFAIRRDSYRDFMATHGLGGNTMMESSDGTDLGGYDAGRRLLERGGTPPTAVFVSNDFAAAGLLTAAADLGLRIPTDLSVATIDNSFLSRSGTTPLTSVDTHSEEQGRLAGESIIRRILQPASPPQRSLVAPSLRVRRSTAAPAR